MNPRHRRRALLALVACQPCIHGDRGPAMTRRCPSLSISRTDQAGKRRTARRIGFMTAPRPPSAAWGAAASSPRRKLDFGNAEHSNPGNIGVLIVQNAVFPPRFHRAFSSKPLKTSALLRAAQIRFRGAAKCAGIYGLGTAGRGRVQSLPAGRRGRLLYLRVEHE